MSVRSAGDVRVRVASIDDADALVALELACHAAPWSRRMYVDELERPGALRYVAATGDGRLAGGLVAAYLGDAWHLMNVLVDPALQRLGIGRRLVDALLRDVDGGDDDGTMGPEPVTLEVRASNVGALALYERCGFERSGLRPRYYPDGEDAVIMWRMARR